MPAVQRHRAREEMKTKLPRYDNSAMAELIKERIHDADHRKVLFDRLCHGTSYADLQAKHHISKATVYRILKNGLRELFRE